jgi:hypothetical protein
MSRTTHFATALLLLAVSAMPALGQNIFTGGKSGAYFGTLCPALTDTLRNEGFTPTCVETAGSLDNIKRVLAEPGSVAMVQTDAFANWAAANPEEAKKLVTIRADLASEGIYLVSRNLREFGDVVRLVTRVKFVLPPQASGAAQTFENFKKVLPNVFTRIEPGQITYAESAAKAIDIALSADNTVALFVQLPDPTNATFKTVIEKKGNFIPIAARALVNQQINGQAVYALETRPVTEAGLLKNAIEVTTLSTPIMLITQSPETLPAGTNARTNHEDLIKLIRTTPKEKLLPKAGATVSLFNRAFSSSKDIADSLYAKAEEAIKTLK